MLEKMVNSIVTQMSDEKLIEESQKENYVYALLTLTEKIITVGTIIGISICMERFISTVLFLLLFLELRKRTGGFHFDDFLTCYFGTIFSYLMVVFVSELLVNNQGILFGMLTVSIGIIEWIGTVNHPNIHMTDNELARAKQAARIIVLIEAMLIFCFLTLRIEIIYIVNMSAAIILCAILLCVAKIKKQEVLTNEENE
ncbi:MAG: accessory gene regulator B family protein [Lachnospiraceae bacterium]|nr:accessory gene regulator B family protein [Lachnospiraceae bacterium]